MKTTFKSLLAATAMGALALPAFAAEEVKIGLPSWTGAQAIASSAGLDTIQESGQESSPTHPLLADMAQLALHGPEAVVGVMGIGYGLAASTPGVV